MNVKTISINLLRPDPHQPRRDFAESEIRSLAASLAKDGQQVPLIVYPLGELFGIADGERRWRAAQVAELTELSAVVLDTAPTSAQLLKLSLKVNCLRSELKPLDRALAYQRLLEHEQCSQRALAQMLDVSDATVTTYLSVLKLSAEIQSRIDVGEIPLKRAYAIARSGDTATQLNLADQAVAGDLSHDALQRGVRKRRPESVRVKRLVCAFGPHTVTVAGPDRIGLGDLIAILEGLTREARRARAERLDVLTWIRVLRDRATASAAVSAGNV